MNNYYEILEVSQNASKEVIEKAYKVLAKKYHPDLQEESQKKNAEQKMKLINEAYEILSDDEKRRKYDMKLQEQADIERELEYNRIKNENLNNIKNNYDTDYEYIEEDQPSTKKEIKEQIRQEKRAEREYREEQERQYRNYMRSLGYRVKERWTFRKFIKLLKIIGIIIIIIIIIWFLPPTHKLLIQLYEENSIIRALVNVISAIFKGIGNGISTIFRGIFNKN